MGANNDGLDQKIATKAAKFADIIRQFEILTEHLDEFLLKL